MGIIEPRSEEEVVEAVRAALAEEAPLAVEGRGTLAGFGHPVAAERRLRLAGLSGILRYEPAELVMTVRAGTPRADLEAVLAAHRQQLAFEPPDLGGMYGAHDSGTAGGLFAANLAGPRRLRAGAARDHVLGVRAVSGHGELFKAGGAVIKNVTGYDLPKLLAGSWGTLAVLTEITFKVLPAPQTSATVIAEVPGARAATALMRRLAHSPLDAGAIAWLPGEAACAAGLRAGGVAARVEGSAVSVAARTHALRAMASEVAPVTVLEEEASARLWRAVRDVAPLAALGDTAMVRASLPPAKAAALAEWLDDLGERRWYFDQAGGWLWLALPPEVAVQRIAALRAWLDAPEGGSVAIWRARAEIKDAAGVLSPQPPGLAALRRRIEAAFDPRGVLNPGRLYPP